jgi:hypothetical protein
LQAALIGYEHQRAILTERIAAITRELGGRVGNHDAADTVKPKRVISAAGRNRIAGAQQKRWPQAKQAAGTPAKNERTKAKRKMSAAGRDGIAKATRKRWAAYRAEKAAAASSGRAGVQFNQSRNLPKEVAAGMSFSDFLEFEKDWSVTNRERGMLIDKSISGTLSSEERRRLDALQTYADYHIDQVSPRPTDVLDELEKRLFSGLPKRNSAGS